MPAPPAKPSTDERDFDSCRRIVVKIGTSTLAPAGRIDRDYIASIATQFRTLRDDGRQMLLVTSGAIGMGAKELQMKTTPNSVKLRQACAAVGQPLLMHAYHDAFRTHDITVAQVLLTNKVLDRRSTYLNMRAAVDELLALNVVPIFNENDCVSVVELDLAFGDNDRLSARIAAKVDADLLIMLSDVDAFYDADPRRNPDARPLHLVSTIDRQTRLAAGKTGSPYATGGMDSKLTAVTIAGRAGCATLIANGREPDILARLLAGQPLGTLFPARSNLSERKRWILNSTAHGMLRIDDGALQAIQTNNSLLPKGLITVEGSFEAGDIVDVGLPASPSPCARLVSALSGNELRQVVGRHSSQIAATLGPGTKRIIARPEDIVLIDD